MNTEKSTNLMSSKSTLKSREQNGGMGDGKHQQGQRTARQMGSLAMKGIYSVSRNLDSNFRC